MSNLKIIFVVLVIYFVGFSKVRAIEPTFSYIPSVYSNRVGESLYSGQLAYMYLEGKLVYCLDPYLVVGSNYNVNDNYINTITDDDLDYLELVAFYGYNKTNRNSIYYYMATQEIIWEKKLGPNKIFWTTQKNGLGDRYDIKNYKDEIKADVERFFVKPSFNGEYIEHPFFTTLQLWDMNSVINDYDIIFDGKSIITKENNYLSINFLDSTTKEVILRKKPNIVNSITGKYTTAYSASNSQTLVSFGQNHIYESKFYIKTTNSYNSRVGLIFYDKDTGKVIPDIEFNIINIEDNSNVTSNFQNNEGLYKSDNFIKIGSYKIILSSNKYILGEDLKFQINEEKSLLDYNEFKFYVESVKGKLIIVDDDEDCNYKLYAGEELIYGDKVYNKDELVLEYTNKIVENLPIGKYYLVKNDKIDKPYNIIFELKNEYFDEIEYLLIIPKDEVTEVIIEEEVTEVIIEDEVKEIPLEDEVKEIPVKDEIIASDSSESILGETENEFFDNNTKDVLPNTSDYNFYIICCLISFQIIGIGCVKYKN